MDRASKFGVITINETNVGVSFKIPYTLCKERLKMPLRLGSNCSTLLFTDIVFAHDFFALGLTRLK